MSDATLAMRAALTIAFATLYWLATIPLALLGFALVPFAIWFGVTRPSQLTGKPIFTAPDWLALWGNEQDGFDPPWAVASIYKGWPTFWRRYSWAAWRNKVRNLCFVDALSFLHTHGTVSIREVEFGGVLVRVRWSSWWMNELEYVAGKRFGKFGPRLEQPFNRVSWAMRPWGRL